MHGNYNQYMQNYKKRSELVEVPTIYFLVMYIFLTLKCLLYVFYNCMFISHLLVRRSWGS